MLLPSSIVSNSPVNNSKSKMLFSIPKSKRFSDVKEPLCDKFYNLKSMLCNQTTSFGCGKRYEHTKYTKNFPSPNAYAIKSTLSNNIEKRVGFSFGMPWSIYKSVYLDYDKVQHGLFSPGPGTYSVNNSIGKDATKHSMASRKSFERSKYELNVPGPGQYKAVTCINENGRYFYSLYKNSGASLFNPISSTKFIANKSAKFPGPGSYSSKCIEINPENKVFLSQFKNPGRTFTCKEKRTIFLPPNLNTPGPGTYRVKTDFGYGPKLALIEKMINNKYLKKSNTQMIIPQNKSKEVKE